MSPFQDIKNASANQTPAGAPAAWQGWFQEIKKWAFSRRQKLTPSPRMPDDLTHQNSPDELYPKPFRVYITREQRRAWFWIASQAGVSPYDLPAAATNELVRRMAGEMVASGKTIPTDIAQIIAGLPGFKSPKK